MRVYSSVLTVTKCVSIKISSGHSGRPLSQTFSFFMMRTFKLAVQCHQVNYNLPSFRWNNTRTSPTWCDSRGLWSMWTLSSLWGHSILFLLLLLILWEPIPTQSLPFVTTCEVCADFCFETHQAAGVAEGMVWLSMETVGWCGELLVPAMCPSSQWRREPRKTN